MKVAQSCLNLCNPLDHTVHGIQARILERVAFPFSRGSCNPGIEPRSASLKADSSPAEPQGSPRIVECVAYPFSGRSSWLRNGIGVSCIAGRFFTNWAIREESIISTRLRNTYIMPLCLRRRRCLTQDKKDDLIARLMRLRKNVDKRTEVNFRYRDQQEQNHSSVRKRHAWQITRNLTDLEFSVCKGKY